jgi:hypothetical protein
LTFFGLQRFSLRRSRNTLAPVRVDPSEVAFMIAVVGNVLAGIGVISLFTATLRITRAR